MHRPTKQKKTFAKCRGSYAKCKGRLINCEIYQFMDSVNKDGMVKFLKGCGAYKTTVRNVYNILHKTGRKHRRIYYLLKEQGFVNV